MGFPELRQGLRLDKPRPSTDELDECPDEPVGRTSRYSFKVL